MNQMGVRESWTVAKGRPDMIVAVIDSNNALADFTFPAGALGSVGVYTANGTLLDTGTLTVTSNTSVSGQTDTFASLPYTYTVG